MQSLTLIQYPTPVSPQRLNLYPLRQIAVSVLSTPTAGINRREMASSRRESASFKSLAVGRTLTGGDDDGYCTLIDFAGANVGDDLVVLLYHLQHACKRIASLVASPFNSSLGKLSVKSSSSGSDRDAPKPLDIVSNDIVLSSLRNSGKVAVMASEEDDSPTWIKDDGPYVVVVDPLDGSRNIDASIPTGTIFGIYDRLVELDHLPVEEKAELNSLQRGNRLVASGYVLYSSATIFCVTLGSGTHAFTLDHSTGEFVLTHQNIKIPTRGQIYSVNDARYFDWPEGLRKYIDTVRQGKGQNPKKYSARYICSLVADLHRTLLYGGVAMNPRDHLRLVYEGNPLAFLVEQAGGKSSDGEREILSIQPVKLHQRLPLFLGSLEDVAELESYGNVQQTVNPGYDV
ncbi:PREDICTED: fructose-1,6-bisphosphatase, chloroplastic [Camelina sativa]|uniref:fructose-bisphosphatase n=1 Tax=Camelina sativa TaxID=90675 RepID=A0ABM0XDA8_CAMSA|nr:PREDICTED: fructose-1,6-bisphosphatase, chloroplastic [Camelina sativa]